MATFSGKKLPAAFASQHEDCVKRLTRVEEEREAQTRSNRKRFYLAIALLLIWYLGGPFAGQPPFHFAVQAVGIFLVAFAMGVLRALQGFIPLREELASIRLALLNFEDVYGIDFAAGVGNPTETASKLTPELTEKLRADYAALSKRLAAVEGEVEKSLFAIYLDLFEALKPAPKGRDNPQAPVSGEKKQG